MATTRTDILNKIRDRRIKGLTVISGQMEDDIQTTVPAGFIRMMPGVMGDAYRIQKAF
jgi:hypothetical protein